MDNAQTAASKTPTAQVDSQHSQYSHEQAHRLGRMHTQAEALTPATSRATSAGQASAATVGRSLSLDSLTNKRKLYAIEEREESSPVTVGAEAGVPVPDVAYDADVDDVVEPKSGDKQRHSYCGIGKTEAKIESERTQIFELFQPWALKTYGDQAKTKTITLRKKGRILKALEGKEHSRPDSSKFRFWVKTKGFTTKRPDCFEEAAGSQRRLTALPSNAVLSDHPAAVDLFAASTTKDFGRRVYRKVACVEEFFDIIYNVHMELGGRSGMHAGQKRTYRIITETYAFLPREAVTRFLTICPECKKNLRPSSPSVASLKEELANESSSEVEALNYSSHTESSLEAGPTAKKRRHSNAECGLVPKSHLEAVELAQATSSAASTRQASPVLDLAAKPMASVPNIRVKAHLQRPISPTPSCSPTAAPKAQVTAPQSLLPAATLPLPGCFDMQLLKPRDSFLRYYEFMRRFYAGGSADFLLRQPVLAPPIYGSSLLQSLSYPTANASTTGNSNNNSNSGTSTSNQTNPQSPKLSQQDTVTLSAESVTHTTKKFKSSPDSLKHAKSAHSPSLAESVTSGAINLTKTSLFRSNGTPPPPTTDTAPQTPTPAQLPRPTETHPIPLTSTPNADATIKLELASPPKPLPELRIPQVRTQAPQPVAPPSILPPLDLESLKPITSTYLQLTRSMGLSDEDALRFDSLLSC